MPCRRARSVRVGAPDGATLGFLEIDRVVAGRCCGGIRASATVTAEELCRIAAVMTLKCSFVGLAAGGAKGGIVIQEGISPEQRVERLAACGRGLAAIFRSGTWSHGVDLGTTPDDLATIREGAGLGCTWGGARPSHRLTRGGNGDVRESGNPPLPLPFTHSCRE